MNTCRITVRTQDEAVQEGRVGIRSQGWLLFSTVMTLILAGCGGGSTFNVQNPPPPGSSAVTIAFQPAPPGSILYTSSTPVTAVVSNDPSQAGVDWVLNCQATGNCGSLNPQHTTSGQPVNYTPPATLSSDNQVVSILAFATADHSQNVTASITLSAYGSILKGMYVLHTNGINGSFQPFQRVGAISLDGSGRVTSGEETVNYVNSGGTLTSVTDPITVGGYFVGQDGRGTLTLRTNDTNLGQQGIETYALVVLSSAQALVTKMDDLNSAGLTNNESSVGTLDLQTSTGAPTGGYAFVAGGTDINTAPIGLGGILNIDSPGGISGAGSNFDLARDDGSGTITPSSAVTGTVSAADPFGGLQINLTTDFGPIQFTGYIVDGTHMQLIETDDSSGAGFGVTAGVALGQGSATGKFTSKNSFIGTFVFGIFGQDFAGSLNSLSAAGTFHSGGFGSLNKGYLDESQLQLDPRDPSGAAFVQVSDAFHGTYSVDPSGSGRMDTLGPAGPSVTFSHLALNGTGPELVFYLSGQGGPALILDADIESNTTQGLYGGGVGTGIAYPVGATQTFGGSPAQSYGLSLTQNLAGQETDATGDMNVDSSAQTLSGVVDANIINVPTLDLPVSDPFQTTAINGRVTGTLATPLSDIAVGYYIIDPNHGFLVETDSATTGALTFGYFATRTPVCAGCP